MLHGVRDEATTRALIVQENRRYARRQLIWFRKEPTLMWFDGPGEAPDVAGQVMAACAAAVEQHGARLRGRLVSESVLSEPVVLSPAFPSAQDVFLNHARRERAALVDPPDDGAELRARIKAFDRFCGRRGRRAAPSSWCSSTPSLTVARVARRPAAPRLTPGAAWQPDSLAPGVAHRPRFRGGPVSARRSPESSSSSSTASASASCPTPPPTATRAATRSATWRARFRWRCRTCASLGLGRVGGPRRRARTPTLRGRVRPHGRGLARQGFGDRTLGDGRRRARPARFRRFPQGFRRR